MNEQPALPLGMVKGMPAEQYHADPGVSNGMLSAMNKSPAHCWALHMDPFRPEREVTKSMFGGTLTHCASLEEEAISQRYVVLPADAPAKPSITQINAKSPSQSTVAQIAWWDDFRSRAAGRDIVSSEQYASARAQVAALLQVTALRNLLKTGDAETSVFWKDKATGLRCRARPDWLHWTGPRRVTPLDIKTIADLTPEAVQRAIATYGYHRQAAHYSNGLRAQGLEVDDFVFGFVSSSYPFLAVAYVLDDESMQQGRDEVAELLDLHANCVKRGEWPAFGDGYQLTSLPKWSKRNNEVEISYV